MYVCVCGRLCTTESRQRAAFKLKYQKVVRSSVVIVVVVVVTSLRVVVICCWPRRCPLCALLYVRFVRFLWRIRAVIVLSSIPYIVEGSAGDSKTLNNLRNSTHTTVPRRSCIKTKSTQLLKKKLTLRLRVCTLPCAFFYFPVCVCACARRCSSSFLRTWPLLIYFVFYYYFLVG